MKTKEIINILTEAQEVYVNFIQKYKNLLNVLSEQKCYQVYTKFEKAFSDLLLDQVISIKIEDNSINIKYYYSDGYYNKIEILIFPIFFLHLNPIEVVNYIKIKDELKNLYAKLKDTKEKLIDLEYRSYCTFCEDYLLTEKRLLDIKKEQKNKYDIVNIELDLIQNKIKQLLSELEIYKEKTKDQNL